MKKQQPWKVISVPWNERDGDGADWFVVYWKSRTKGIEQTREVGSRKEAFTLCRKLNEHDVKPQ